MYSLKATDSGSLLGQDYDWLPLAELALEWYAAGVDCEIHLPEFEVSFYDVSGQLTAVALRHAHNAEQAGKSAFAWVSKRAPAGSYTMEVREV